MCKLDSRWEYGRLQDSQKLTGKPSQLSRIRHSTPGVQSIHTGVYPADGGTHKTGRRVASHGKQVMQSGKVHGRVVLTQQKISSCSEQRGIVICLEGSYVKVSKLVVSGNFSSVSTFRI